MLVLADPLKDWSLFVDDLTPGAWLVLYANPGVATRDLTYAPKLVLVQPDPWVAGHLLDLWEHCQPK